MSEERSFNEHAGARCAGRPLHDPLTEPDGVQRLADDPLRPREHQPAQVAGHDAVPSRYQSGDATAVHEGEVGQIDDDGRTRDLRQRVGQEGGGHDVQLAAESHDVRVKIGNVADGNAELGQHGDAIPPKVAGGTLPGDRSALSCYPSWTRADARSRRPTPIFTRSGDFGPTGNGHMSIAPTSVTPAGCRERLPCPVWALLRGGRSYRRPFPGALWPPPLSQWPLRA